MVNEGEPAGSVVPVVELTGLDVVELTGLEADQAELVPHLGGTGPFLTTPMTRKFENENLELASLSLLPGGHVSFPGTQPELYH